MFSVRRAPAKVVQQTARNFSPIARINELVTDLFGEKPKYFPLDVPPVGFPTSPSKVESSDEYKMTTLPTGLKVVTHPSNNLTSTLAVHVDVGSRYESPDVRGITHFMERMLLKSSTNRLEEILFRDMAKIGADITATASREGLTITGQSVAHLTRVLGALAEITVRPAFKIHEVIDAKIDYAAANADRNGQPDVAINNAIHTAAFGSVGLGAPQHALASHLELFTPETLSQWHELFFSGDRITIAASGVEHESFVEMCEHLFAHVKRATPMERIPTVFEGSSIRLTNRDYRGLTHVALGFQAQSWADKDVYAASVLQTLMGGGDAYSAGGPGKGMYSRLYQDVLAKHNWVESATCFNNIYSDAGLFGFYATVPPEAAGAAVDVLLEETRKMSTIADPQEVSRAKNVLLSNVLTYLENPISRTEEMARSVTCSGNYDVNNLVNGIRSVTDEDVVRVAKKMMESPIASATYGKASSIPREIKL